MPPTRSEWAAWYGSTTALLAASIALAMWALGCNERVSPRQPEFYCWTGSGELQHARFYRDRADCLQTEHGGASYVDVRCMEALGWRAAAPNETCPGGR